MCFGGWRIQDPGNDSRSSIMCSDFGCVKMQEGFSTIPFKINLQGPQDLRTVGAQGGRIEGILISIFFGGP